MPSSPAGIRGTVTRFLLTIPTPSATMHFYELDVASLDAAWPEAGERKREWVTPAEAIRRVQWKPELTQALLSCSLVKR